MLVQYNVLFCGWSAVHLDTTILYIENEVENDHQGILARCTQLPFRMGDNILPVRKKKNSCPRKPVVILLFTYDCFHVSDPRRPRDEVLMIRAHTIKLLSRRGPREMLCSSTH